MHWPKEEQGPYDKKDNLPEKHPPYLYARNTKDNYDEEASDIFSAVPQGIGIDWPTAEPDNYAIQDNIPEKKVELVCNTMIKFLSWNNLCSEHVNY